MKRLLLPVLVLAGSLAQPALAQDTLYDRLGGKDGVARIVDQSFTLFLADPRVKDDFDNISPTHFKMRLAEEFCMISGGPCAYRGEPIRQEHSALGVTQAKFNAVAEDVQAAMHQVGIPFWTQNQLLALLAPMQRDIVTK
jgi:hemoglobin